MDLPSNVGHIKIPEVKLTLTMSGLVGAVLSLKNPTLVNSAGLGSGIRSRTVLERY